jgi:choline monooxygenase
MKASSVEFMTLTERSQLSKPHLEATTLPPRSYWAPEFFEREVEHIFAREWIAVGRVDDVAEPGDYFTVTVGTEPVIVVRDGDGEVHAHINTCRHRGCELVRGSGRTTVFRCPYHGWMYALDGKLRGAPAFKDTENFGKGDYPLHSAQAEVWNGYVLVNLDADAHPYRDQVSDCTLWGLDAYGLNEQTAVTRVEFELQCNWKIFAENFIEEYHTPWVHGTTLQPVAPMANWKEFPDLSDQPWSFMVGQFPGISMSDSGEPRFPLRPELSDLAPEFSGMAIWLSHPSFGLVVNCDCSLYFFMLPDGPERMKLVVGLCVPDASAQAFHAGDPATVNAVEEYARNHRLVSEEDNAIVEAQARGLKAQAARPGRYCKYEGLAWKFDQWVARTAYGLEG